jgi:hypothetical protein
VTGDSPVEALVRRSRLVRVAEATAAVVSEAWWRSSLRRRITAFIGPAGDPATRVRLAGWAAIGATVTHLLLLGAAASVTSLSSILGWFGLLAAAAICVRYPHAVMAAWAWSQVRRLY